VKQTRDERRKIADEAHQEARLLWQRGREDRMAERPMDPLFRINLYYRTAYEGERRKEVRRHADK
jgi:hypothetical protein